MKGKGRSRQAILAAVTVLAAAQAGTAYASTGPASESGVQTGAWIQEGQDWERTERSRLDGLRPRMAGIIWIRRPDG